MVWIHSGFAPTANCTARCRCRSPGSARRTNRVFVDVLRFSLERIKIKGFHGTHPTYSINVLLEVSDVLLSEIPDLIFSAMTSSRVCVCVCSNSSRCDALRVPHSYLSPPAWFELHLRCRCAPSVACFGSCLSSTRSQSISERPERSSFSGLT